MKKKVLVVEDDELLNIALSTRLSRAGYEVVKAFDALSGVQLLVREKPQVVVLDITMPAGSGFTVAERAQKLPGDVPIIFVTGQKDPRLKAHADALGAAGFFAKPYDGEVLVEAVRDVLGDPTPEPVAEPR